LADDGIAAMTRIYAGKMMPAAQIAYFSDPDRVFATRTIRAGAPVRPLSYAAKPLDDLPIHSRGITCDLYDYISRNRVAGLLIMKQDEVVLEHYDLGIDAATRWVSMSVAKSVSTTLVGVAVHDGLIGSIDDPLVRYLPELAGSAYQDVSIKTLMQMTSGVRWDDTQVNPDSERRRMLQLQLDRIQRPRYFRSVHLYQSEAPNPDRGAEFTRQADGQ
jgi:CubicO group peptidase (beta-lactamase class C family)